MALSRMFSFITDTWNPLAGECSHKCTGCWARAMAKHYGMEKYQGQPRIDEKQIERRFKAGDFVFVQDMSDLFAEDVPRQAIIKVLKQIGESPNAEFLLLTKNPARYLEFMYPLSLVPENCVLGATIESDCNEPRLGQAPDRLYRIASMSVLQSTMKMRASDNKPIYRLFVSVEPILEFDLEKFSALLVNHINPWAVAVGMDNYNNGFPEPHLKKTLELIEKLESNGIKVYRKTLREAANK